MVTGFCGGHQPAPNSRHRDLLLALNAQPSLGMFLPSSFNLNYVSLHLPFAFFTSVYLPFTASLCLAGCCFPGFLPQAWPSFSPPSLPHSSLLFSEPRVLFILSACQFRLSFLPPSYSPFCSLLDQSGALGKQMKQM